MRCLLFQVWFVLSGGGGGGGGKLGLALLHDAKRSWGKADALVLYWFICRLSYRATYIIATDNFHRSYDTFLLLYLCDVQNLES